jgi:hypothetical protein
MKLSLKAGFAAALLGCASLALASPTIELNDGSRIQGEIQSLANGVYTVVSPSLGTVQVPQSNVARIVYGGAAPEAPVASAKAPARDDSLGRDIQQMSAQMAQDPATMQAIMNLQSDPQIQAILNDPTIAKAIQDGDYASLMSNAKIQALENNSQIKRLVGQQAH